MPISLTCSSCASRITAPERMIGKTSACPKCSAKIVVAAPSGDDSGVEVVKDELPVATTIRKAQRVFEPDEPSRRRRHDESEDDDRYPRRRVRRSEKNGGFFIWIFVAIGGVVALAIGAVAVLLVVNSLADEKPVLSKVEPRLPVTSVAPPAPEWEKAPMPENWILFKDPAGRFSVGLPDQPKVLPPVPNEKVKVENWVMLDGNHKYGMTVFNGKNVDVMDTPEKKMSNLAHGFLNRMASGQIPLMTEIRMGNRQGLETLVRCDDGQMMLFRIVQSKDWYYMFTFVGTVGLKASDPDPKAFFGSVEIVE